MEKEQEKNRKIHELSDDELANVSGRDNITGNELCYEIKDETKCKSKIASPKANSIFTGAHCKWEESWFGKHICTPPTGYR